MKKSLLVLVAFVLSFGLQACANKSRLVSSPIVPAAVGDVELSTDDNNNTKVKLEVKYLAPPSTLSPPRSAYVVWTRSGTSNPEKQGVLEIGDDRDGEIEFITPARDFEVIVTAEESPDARYPSSTVALRSDVNR